MPTNMRESLLMRGPVDATAAAHAAQLAEIATDIGGAYALIETVTVGAGGATSIARTAEPDETPYAFTGVMIDVHLVGVLESNGDITIAPEGNSVALPPYAAEYFMSGGNDAYFRVTWLQEYGIWKLTYADFVFTAGDSSVVSENLSTPVLASDCAAIDTISITSTAGLPEGCIIKIYGIRA